MPSTFKKCLPKRQKYDLTSFFENFRVLLIHFIVSTYSKNLGEESCYPELKTSGSSPMVRFVQGKHPIVIAANPNLAYIPNDFQLDESLAILTGANMG